MNRNNLLRGHYFDISAMARSLEMLLTVLESYRSQQYLVFRCVLAGKAQSVDDRNVSQ